MAVPIAVGDPSPAWLLPGHRPWLNASRDFGAPRKPRKGETVPRFHTGVDLVAPAGTVVVAAESGTVVAVIGWDGPNTAGLVVRGDSGLILVYGGLDPRSIPAKGARVWKGEPIGTIGTYPNGGQMAHIETWWGRTDRPAWYQGSTWPEGLRDPRQYLLSMSEAIIMDPEHVGPGPAPPAPYYPPEPEPAPSSSSGGAGIVALLIFVAAIASDGDS